MFKLKKLLGIAFAFAIFLASAGVASANPSYVGPTVQTASATTSPAFMTPGTATSTLSFDAYNPTTNTFVADKLALLMQFTGSSTASILGVNFEYSQDGIDWYKNTIVNAESVSTTSPVLSLNTPTSMSWAFASTTLNGAAGTSAIATRIVSVPIYTRFVRAVTTLTGANGAFWGQFIPIKELK
jgi:hypothetical protein